MVHREFKPIYQTANDKFYPEVFEYLRFSVWGVRKDITNICMFHHDNELHHMSLIVSEALAKQNVKKLSPLPYSLNLAPIAFFFLLD